MSCIEKSQEHLARLPSEGYIQRLSRCNLSVIDILSTTQDVKARGLTGNIRSDAS
jgi:hypothetical protein